MIIIQFREIFLSRVLRFFQNFMLALDVSNWCLSLVSNVIIHNNKDFAWENAEDVQYSQDNRFKSAKDFQTMSRQQTPHDRLD